jgi:hypothetical protein
MYSGRNKAAMQHSETINSLQLCFVSIEGPNNR